MSHLNFLNFGIFHQFLSCQVTLFDPKTFQNGHLFGIFKQLLSTQNVNVARFARNDEWR